MLSWLTGTPSTASCGGLGYAITNESTSICIDGIWKIYEGKSTKISTSSTPNNTTSSNNSNSNNVNVTVFKTDKSTLNPSQLSIANHRFVNCTKLLHPFILKTIEVVDTNKTESDKGFLVIVCEKVTPLREFIQTICSTGIEVKCDRTAIVNNGVKNVMNGMEFINESCLKTHGCLTLDAIYVTTSGDFKIGNLDLITGIDKVHGPDGHFSRHEKFVMDAGSSGKYRSLERVNNDINGIISGGVNAIDSYSFAYLLEDVYALIGNKKVPEQLTKAVVKLKSVNGKERPKISSIKRCPIFNTRVINTIETCLTLPTTDQDSKIQFYTSLPDLLASGVLHGGLVRYRLLPCLVNSLTLCQTKLQNESNRRELLLCVPSVFSIGDTIANSNDGSGNDGDEYFNELGCVLLSLFNINDRAVRGNLLNRMSTIAARFSPAHINSTIFTSITSGFTDSSSQMRELTLKSLTPIIPILTPANVDKLSRFLVRLQGDSEASIRTNTVIFISKIASKLTGENVQRVALPAFLRGSSDPFVHCRLASLRGLYTLKESFSVEVVSKEIWPSLGSLTIDVDSTVRNEAGKCVDVFASVLRNRSNEMDVEDEKKRVVDMKNKSLNGYANNNTRANNESALRDGGGDKQASGSSFVNFFQNAAMPSKPLIQAQSNKVVVQSINSSNNNSKQMPEITSNGWGDNDDDIDFDFEPKQSVVTKLTNKDTGEGDGWGGDDDYDDDDDDDLLDEFDPIKSKAKGNLQSKPLAPRPSPMGFDMNLSGGNKPPIKSMQMPIKQAPSMPMKKDNSVDDFFSNFDIGSSSSSSKLNTSGIGGVGSGKGKLVMPSSLSPSSSKLNMNINNK